VILSLVTITFKYKLKWILTTPTDLGKGSIKVLGLEMENGLFSTEIEVNALIKEQAFKHMDIIHFIYKDKVKNTSMLIISEAQVQWM